MALGMATDELSCVMGAIAMLKDTNFAGGGLVIVAYCH